MNAPQQRNRPRTGLTADSTSGRVLLALRAGRMTSSEIRERFPTGNPDLAGLARRGLVRVTSDGEKGSAYQLTDAGRAACPLRNPLVAAVPMPATSVAAARRISASPIQSAQAPMPQRIAQSTTPPTMSVESNPTTNGGIMEKDIARPPHVARRAPRKRAEQKDDDGIEFSMYDDGRLAIVDGDEIFVVPPAATRRLAFFLGCFETDTAQPRAA